MSGLSAVQVRRGDNEVRQIAAHICGTRFKPSSHELREHAKRLILDAVVCAAAGYTDHGAQAIASVAIDQCAKGDSPIWFTGERSSALGASWANSAATAALDLDDGNAYSRGHIAAVAVPVALSNAHKKDANFDNIATAICIGYDAGNHVGTARTVYGNSGTWTAFAAVATAAAQSSIEPGPIEHALGICGESSPNQSFMSARSKDPVPEGSHVKEGIPWSVNVGLNALYLAEKNFTGPRNVLDSVQYRYRPECTLRTGSILDTYFKPYACCRHIHAAIAALRDLMSQNRIEATSIQKILVETSHWGFTLQNKTAPENLPDVQYSIPYCLALVALNGTTVFQPLRDATLFQRDVEVLAKKVSVVVADDMPKERATMETPARVTITTVAGQTVTSPTTEAEWGVNQPPSWDNLLEKAKIVTKSVFTDEQSKEFMSALDELKEERIERLMDFLGKKV